MGDEIPGPAAAVSGLRTVALAAAVLVGAAPGAAAQSGGAAAGERPNLVLFIGDDLGVEDSGPYGNRVVRTPRLDELASQSLRFERAFAASPTCSPSRSVLYTGLMPFRNGAHANHGGANPGTRALPDYLRALGYRVALAGKVHVKPRDVFDFEYIRGSAAPEPGFEERPALRRDLKMEVVDRWLAELPEGQPFALVVGDFSPHVIWPDRSAYDPAEVDIPHPLLDTPGTREARARYYTDVEKMDRNVGMLLESLDRHGLAENTLLVFTSDQGPQWPFAKWNLYDAGIQVPMLVRWPGRVQPGTSTRAMASLVDLLPTLVEAAGGSAPPGLDGRSLLPVLLGRDAAHRDAVFASHTGDGDMNRTPMRMLRTGRYKYILNLAPDVLYTTHIDRAGNDPLQTRYWREWLERSFQDPEAAAVLWRYHHRPAEELYDLRSDPDETRNLAADPAHAAVLARLRARLAEWRARQRDHRTGPEALPGDSNPHP